MASTSLDTVEFRNNTVKFNTQDRQWDCRFNVQLESDLTELLATLSADTQSGRIKYLLVGGVVPGKFLTLKGAAGAFQELSHPSSLGRVLFHTYY